MATALLYRAVALRSATPADCERVWAWNFASDVRALSKTNRAVTLAAHTRWYEKRLAESGSPMWIIEEGGEPVGVLRLDRRDQTTRISLALDARVRGRGVGRRAITAACETWGQPIIAEILDTNTASRLAFEACGFVRLYHTDKILTYRWSP